MKSKLLLGDWFMNPKLLCTGVSASAASCVTGFSSLWGVWGAGPEVFMNEKPL